MNTMQSAPRTGQRILLCYKLDSRHTFGEKWEECRWISEQATTGSPPHWQPWEGENIRTTHHIHDSDAVGWLPLPEL